ncbi:hypothetical protein AAZX31_19G208900 [Glycine max]|nr:hypothetical protein GLYMA_19G222451v4 [Glycine max]
MTFLKILLLLFFNCCLCPPPLLFFSDCSISNSKCSTKPPKEAPFSRNALKSLGKSVSSSP